MKTSIYLIFSFFLSSGTVTPLFSQLDSLEAVPVNVEPDKPSDSTTTRAKFLSNISFTTDYGKILVGFLADYENKLDFSTHILFFDKFQISAEYGKSTLNPRAFENAVYESSGTYFRVGVDYQRAISVVSNISLGLRYALSNYQDKLDIQIISESSIFDNYRSSDPPRTSLEAIWWEIVATTESKLFNIKGEKLSSFQRALNNFYVGAHLRIRFMDRYPRQHPIDTYTIPGYGRTFDKSVPAVNLMIKYRIPL